MLRAIIFSLLLFIFIPDTTKISLDSDKALAPDVLERLHPMEALDIVKEVYATNFTKISLEKNPYEYFYKLDNAEYYLVYEDTDDKTGNYLFHLYEFVQDDIDTGIGHTVTYGWYWMNPYTEDVWEYP